MNRRLNYTWVFILSSFIKFSIWFILTFFLVDRLKNFVNFNLISCNIYKFQFYQSILLLVDRPVISWFVISLSAPASGFVEKRILRILAGTARIVVYAVISIMQTDFRKKILNLETICNNAPWKLFQIKSSNYIYDISGFKVGQKTQN
jgi:hypothetical protein